jgi:hypothetical protein
MEESNVQELSQDAEKSMRTLFLIMAVVSTLGAADIESYKLACSTSSTGEVHDAVNGYIQRGYVPLGPVSLSISRNSVGTESWLICQTMVKYKSSPTPTPVATPTSTPTTVPTPAVSVVEP